jgi:tol-pal system protein YbgF
MAGGGLDTGMHGISPKTLRALAGLVLLTGCAHAALPAPANTQDAELARLRAELAQRDQTIVQLEGRLSLAEAGQRQLRAELQRSEELPAPQSVRIGGRVQPAEPAHEEPVVREPEGPRPMLRLSGERGAQRVGPREQPEFASTWTPPATSERLSVVPLPDAPRRAPASVAAPAPLAQDDLYARGLDLLRRREFAEASRELAAFVAAHPRDPRVGRAHFFRAELMFAERDYKRALATFEQSLRSDPMGDKAPDAMLRCALCQLQLGARDKARALLGELRTKFPDSDAARRSEQVMEGSG